MDIQTARKGNDIANKIEHHKYHLRDLKSSEKWFDSTTDPSLTPYEVNKVIYPRDVGIEVVSLLIKHHESAIAALTEELAAL